MKRTGVFVAATLAVASCLMALPAAAATRTFVSGAGTDTGTCSVTAPCRSFAYALTQTAAGGEIVVLGSAGYGSVTINEAVSITNEEGVEAAVTVTSGTGITVSAGATDTVNLTGLTLIGNGGINGIAINTAGTVTIQNCVVDGFIQSGITYLPAASTALYLLNSTVSHSGNNGLNISSTASSRVTASLQNVQLIANGENGLSVDSSLMSGAGFIQLAVVNSTVSGNNTDGIAAFSAADGGSTNVWALNSTLSFNSNAGLAETGVNTTGYIGSSRIMGNGVNGFALNSSAVLKTFSNNLFTDFTESGSSGAISLQ